MSIVAANVGASAGGAVIPEPQAASYATWPSLIGKTVDDIKTIMLAKLEMEEAGKTNKPPGSGPNQGQSGTPEYLQLETYSSVFNRDTLILIGIGLAIYVGFRFLK